ncbi:hypothetical protein Sango_1569600 [Sesamum angolense]|uniref:DUF4216 domain-containing protein n=1 Tax=Sesamum angolense TaxID=2727404 RepID=A0AAE1WPU6_9LAMI|nr:hypothetical protein Sango_1569600 [Sesamum angolense]
MQRFMSEYYNWISHGEDNVQDYFEAPSVPQVSEEPTPDGYVEGVLTDGMRSCPVDVDLSSYCYGSGPYKPSRGRDPHQKKSPYVVLRYLLLTPRLQRLYSSRATAKHITWHATNQTEEGSMCCPSDANAWKYFDQIYPDFAEESHNVQHLIDVYLESLFEELLQLWYLGVRTYDHTMDQAFIMRAALMWTVKDLPTYRMASAWSTAGVMGQVTSVHAYFVNGYNFQTERHNTDKSTMNCGVDLVRGMKVHLSYHLVDVNFKKLYQKDDPFILAQQAVRVYFTEYPSTSRRQLHENDDKNEDEDEDHGGDDETDDEEYETT